MPLASGTRLGPYVLQSLLGSGGMGEVYRAEDSRLHRTVAIKILPEEAATPERIERFQQEARAASALNHPNILTIHDVGREGPTAYLAMEWVEGHTLRQLLREGPIPLRRTIRLAQQIADGLAKAHAAGIVHRDLKPENVMVTTDGLAKIVDFGLAKSTPAAIAGVSEGPTVTRPAATDPGMVVGTMGYMSPEQVSGRPVDYRSDQFALGLVIYELATRTRPFERATTAQSLAAVIDEDPAPIGALNPEVPPSLAAIVARCLSKDPADRYDSTRDLAHDLKDIAESTSRQTAVAVPVRPRRMPPLAAGVGVVLLIAAAAALWVWRPAARPSSVPDRPLLAVRPFQSLSNDAQQAYFATGMADEIRAQLSQVSALRVLSRTGLDGYRENLAGAVRDLGIGQFVDGSVRVDGGRVRVSAELVDAATRQTLWSQTYDRELADMLTVQGDVALQIARALQGTLSPREQERLEHRATGNADAYALYLQARQLGPLTDRAKNLAGQELLRRALTLDPGFALARATLAYRVMFMSFYDSPSYVDKGVAEAEEALRADPGLAYGYFVVGTGYSLKGMDAQARQAYLRALELDPNNVSALHNFSNHEAIFGHLDESLYLARRAFGLSGQRGNDYHHVGLPLLFLRADDVNREWLLDGERRNDFHRIQVMLAFLELWQGHTDDALKRTAALTARNGQDEEVKQHQSEIAFLVDSPDQEKSVQGLYPRAAENYVNVAESVRLRYAFALAKRGDARAGTLIAEAEQVARDKLNAGNGMPPLRIELAAAAALRHDKDEALQWLERAFEAGQRDYATLELDPILAPLRGEPRFKAVMEKMRQDVDAQRARAAERGLLDLKGLLAK